MRESWAMRTNGDFQKHLPKDAAGQASFEQHSKNDWNARATSMGQLNAPVLSASASLPGRSYGLHFQRKLSHREIENLPKEMGHLVEQIGSKPRLPAWCEVCSLMQCCPWVGLTYVPER